MAIRRESDIMEGLRGWQAISEEMESGSCLWIDVEMEMEMVYYCRDEGVPTVCMVNIVSLRGDAWACCGLVHFVSLKLPSVCQR